MALKPFSERSERGQVATLRSLVVGKFKSEGRPLATCRKIAHQHNTTFCAVGRQGEHWFVRLSRTSARTPEQVQAEVAWVQDLAEEGSRSKARLGGPQIINRCSRDTADSRRQFQYCRRSSGCGPTSPDWAAPIGPDAKLDIP
jgi:hypothetical protein